jgi:hypothetical protein
MVLFRLILKLATAATDVAGHQLPPFHIKPGGFIHQPFVMAVAAQGIALVLAFEWTFFEG